MISVTINNKEITVSKDLTILQAATLANIQIPRFCFHEKLSIAGNCRMCLVEMANVNKPVASCAMSVSQGMQIYTNSVLVKKAREGVLELLLANHPLDCPICDQGGECDLQDQALIFGNDRSRFYETKRAVLDKTISPFIKTIMTRCIHCTRCIRFMSEVAGVNQLGATGRGSHTEIGTYVENSINSEISGNIIDLCPVGALTSKPYAFVSRPWELKATETIDLSDALGTNIKIDTRGTTIMRVQPKINEALNEEWITDKTRFNFDGFKLQRLNSPLYVQKTHYIYNFSLKNKSNAVFHFKQKKSFFVNCSWENAFKVFKEFYDLLKIRTKNQNQSVNFIAGNQVNLESLLIAKKLFPFATLCNQYENHISNTNINIDFDKTYLSNNLPKTIENVDVCLLVGLNLRLENPLLNSRLRKAFLYNNAKISSIGPKIDSMYNLNKIGNSLRTFVEILEGKHLFSLEIANSKSCLILFNDCYLNKISQFCSQLPSFFDFKSNIHFSVLNPHANFISLKEFGISNKVREKKYNLYFNLKNDEIVFNKQKNNTNNFFVYVGFHGDRSVNFSDLILPCFSPLEENSSFFNILGDVQQNNMVVNGPEYARTSWKILHALSVYCKIYEDSANDTVGLFSEFGLKKNTLKKFELNKKSFKQPIWFSNTMLNNFVSNFYKTDSVSRISKIMSIATKTNKKMFVNF